MSKLPWTRHSASRRCAFLDSRLRDQVLTWQNHSGSYFLTELHHGLDVINLETTATLRPDGSFDLHTPHKGAAKSVPSSYLVARCLLIFETRFMPPAIPCGTPLNGIVFARLLVDGEDRGVKPFLVPIHDEHSMYPGVTAKFVLSRLKPPTRSLTLSLRLP